MEKDQIQVMINEGIQSATTNIIRKIIEKLNIYNLLQVIWLIEIYYLVINSINEKVQEILRSDQTLPKLDYVPSQVRQYNAMILNYMDKWNEFILFLSIVLIFSALIISFVKGITRLSDYKIIKSHCDYGLYSGVWLMLIYFTYRIFVYSEVILIISIPSIALLFYLKDNVKEKINSRRIHY